MPSCLSPGLVSFTLPLWSFTLPLWSFTLPLLSFILPLFLPRQFGLVVHAAIYVDPLPVVVACTLDHAVS